MRRGFTILAHTIETHTQILAAAGCVGYMGEPSYNTREAPIARPLTIQFHIIQPHVVW